MRKPTIATFIALIVIKCSDVFSSDIGVREVLTTNTVVIIAGRTWERSSDRIVDSAKDLDSHYSRQGSELFRTSWLQKGIIASAEYTFKSSKHPPRSIFLFISQFKDKKSAKAHFDSHFANEYVLKTSHTFQIGPATVIDFRIGHTRLCALHVEDFTMVVNGEADDDAHIRLLETCLNHRTLQQAESTSPSKSAPRASSDVR